MLYRARASSHGKNSIFFETFFRLTTKSFNYKYTAVVPDEAYSK